MNQSRREFLKFFGVSTLAVSTISGLSLLSGCATTGNSTNSDPIKNARRNVNPEKLGWTPLAPSLQNDLLLASGLTYSVLIKWQDQIGGSKQKPLLFGTHCDYTSYIPFDASNPNEGIMLVNHEYLNPFFVSGFNDKDIRKKTRAQIEAEIKVVGASLIHIKKENSQWKVITDSKHNTRFDGSTPIPFSSQHPVYGADKAYGTMANCAGGKTPWNTFLTCEENYDMYYGEWPKIPRDGQQPKVEYHSRDYGWYQFFDRPPLHYGWVVEINPVTKKAKKLTSLGRMAHECATCVLAKDGRTVVYTGDDQANEFIYKFISEKPGSLEKGTLYVANTETGKWLPLEISAHPQFKKLYRNQTELLIQTREAARLLGATPQDRPEDIEINPANGDVIVACTNNKEKNRPHGSLLKIVEKDANPLSLDFTSSVWISGGAESMLSCPDNMIFDKAGNLWVTSDRSESDIAKGEYDNFKNNGLYYIPMKGEFSGQVFQVASAPTDAELTGPTFSPDGETLFLCVQHPGDRVRKPGEYSSNWPSTNKNDMPKSAVVTIQGPLLKKLTT